MTSLNKWFWKLIWLLALTYSGTALMNALFAAGVRRNTQLPVNSLVTIALTILMIIFFGLVVEWLQEHSQWQKKLLWISLVIGWLIEIWLSVKLQGAQGVDDFDVRRQVANIVAGHHHWDDYFSFGPNAGTVLLFSRIVKLFGGNMHQSLILNLTNFGFINCAFLSGLGIIRRFGNRASIWYALLGVLFAPLWITALFVYTDVPALGFSMFGFYLYSLSEQVESGWRRLGLIFLAVLSMMFAYFSKANTVILLIALVMYYFLRVQKGPWRNILQQLLILTASIAVSFGIISGIKKIYHVPASTYPATYWVSVGYNAQTDGTVGKNGVETWPGTGLLPNKHARYKYDNRLIKEEVSSNGLLGNLKLYLKKINVQWSLGTVGITTRAFTILSRPSNIYNYLIGIKNGLLQVLSQCVYLIILVGMLYVSVAKLKSSGITPSIPELMALYFVGIFSFHTFFWEVQERYAYIAVIPMIVLGSLGLALVSTRSLSFIHNPMNHSRHAVITLVGVLVILSIGLIPNFKNLVAKDGSQVVVGQNFLRMEPISLQSGKTLMEDIVVKGAFSNIAVNTGVHNDKLRVTVNNTLLKHGQRIISQDKTEKRYKVVIKNISKKTVECPTLVSPRMDLLQKHIKGHNNHYLGVTVTREVRESNVMIGVITLVIGTVLMFVDVLWICRLPQLLVPK